MKDIELLVPVPEPKEVVGIKAKKVDSLRGKKIAIVDSYNEWVGFTQFSDAVAKILNERYGVECVRYPSFIANSGGHADPTHGRERSEYFDNLAREVSAALVGAAFWGSCTTWCIQAAADIHKKGLPAIAVASEDFVSLAKVRAKAESCPELDMVVLPVEVNNLPLEELVRLAEEKVEEIVGHLAEN